MTLNHKEKLRKRFKIFSAIFKLLILLTILIGIPAYIFFFDHEIIDKFSNLEDIEAFFNEYKTQSVFIYLGLQILQIIICVIPGQGLQFVAGYMYGFWFGYLYSVIGAFIGSVITYYIARILGHDAMVLFFGEERVNKNLETMNSKKAVILVFIIFLIPGVPKDLMNYIAGISEMKLKPFLIVSLIGRSPAMMGSLLVGKQVEVGNYTAAIIIAVIAVVLFLLGIIFRKKITVYMDKAYDKLMKL